MVVLVAGAIQRGFEIRGALGRPNRLGEHWLGWTYLGDDNDMCGVYHRRPRKSGQIIVKMKHYVPTNPRTVAQQNRRQIFRDGIDAWNALTPVEKAVYNGGKYRKLRSGHIGFMRDYLNSHS